MEKDEDEQDQATGDPEKNDEDETANNIMVQETSQPSINIIPIPDGD